MFCYNVPMKPAKLACLCLLPLFAAVSFYVSAVHAEENSSRNMNKAVNLYKAGKLNEAMDAFMDILLHTDSAEERAVANSYLNKISIDISHPESPEAGLLIPEEQGASQIEEAFRIKEEKKVAAGQSGTIGFTPTPAEKLVLQKKAEAQAAAEQAASKQTVEQKAAARKAADDKLKAETAAKNAQLGRVVSPAEAAELGHLPTSIQVVNPAPGERGQVESVTLTPGFAPVRNVSDLPSPGGLLTVPAAPGHILGATPAPAVVAVAPLISTAPAHTVEPPSVVAVPVIPAILPSTGSIQSVGPEYPVAAMPLRPGYSTASVSGLTPDSAIQAQVEAAARDKAAAAAAVAAAPAEKELDVDVSGSGAAPAGLSGETPLTPEEEAARARWMDQVSQKIAAMRRLAVEDLQKTSGVTISLMDNGLPEAIGLSPDALFVKGTVDYKPGAAGTLLRVASLLFTVGKADLVLLPEGTMTGNLGMLDMRRTMAVNSWLVHRGISPARLRANLTAVINKSFPEAFKKISGIGIVFDYTQAKQLSQPAPEQNAPPLLSLGVFPSEIDVSKGEGALIELSAMETAAQITTWELQMLSGEGGKAVSVVKSVSGTGPVYTQTYWNGRSAGQVVPPGMYACILTATDVLGARISIKTFLTISGGVEKLSSQVKPAAGAKPAAKKPPPTALNKQYKEYTLSFKPGSSALSKAGAESLKKVLSGIKTAPLAKVVLTGYAAVDETEGSAANLALRRAKAVSTILSRDYGISEDRVEVRKKVSDTAKPVVKVALVGNSENI